MNIVLAHIYGTHGGLEKTAAELPEGVTIDQLPQNLHDLALALVSNGSEGEDLQKVASAHKAVFEDLVNFDSAGRHIAQAEFSEMEKAAAEGDPSALLEFLSVDEEVDQKAQIRAAIQAELQRRAAK